MKSTIKQAEEIFEKTGILNSNINIEPNSSEREEMWNLTRYFLKKIYELDEEIINNSLVKFAIKENNQSIEIFFDIDNYNLIGWQTKDIYQNTAVTLLYSVKSNQIVDQNIFKAPLQN